MNTSTNETWRPILSLHSRYEASSVGRIRRVGKGRGVKPGRIIGSRTINSGYVAVCLWIGNKAIGRLVHRLVAEAFIGPCPAGFEVNHKDGCKTNNVAENLEYMTRSQNLLHASEVTGKGRGTNNPSCKLSEETVRAVRLRHAQGVGYKLLAREFGISWGSARNIAARRTWAWLE